MTVLQKLAEMRELRETDIETLKEHLIWMRREAAEKSQIWRNLYICQHEETTPDLRLAGRLFGFNIYRIVES